MKQKTKIYYTYLSISNFTMLFDSVENATSYEIFADSNSVDEKTAT